MIHTLPRHIALEGATNVRDIGGYPALGGHIRYGKVYRSAVLSGLTPTDIETLKPLGIRHFADLRGGREAAASPSRVDGLDITLHALSIEPSIGASLRDLRDTARYTGENVMGLLTRAYVSYALEWSHRYRALFALLLEPQAGPVLFHCSAGKDRTGFGTALLMRSLGVEMDVVVQDYLATNRLWQPDASLARELPPEIAAVMLSAHPEWLEAAFAAINREFGTLDVYFEQKIGLDPAARQQLRRQLIA